MKTLVTSGPAVEPISLTEAKLHLRVSNTVENAGITLAIETARRYVETFIGPLITQTIEEYFDAFPAGDRLQLTHPQVQSVTSIVYIDTADTPATFTASYYQLSAYGRGRPAEIWLKDGRDWPITTLQTVDGVKVTYVAGFGDAATDVPAEIRSAILLLLGHFYQNREQELRGNNTVPSSLQLGVFSLISDYRTHR